MWQTGTTGASNSYREMLTNIVACATSQHISAVVINAAGTGYTVGDILTITHAGAYFDCTIEVLTVGGSGEVTSAKIRNMGAFSNRLASAVVNAGGSGYVVGDILQIQGGTYTERAKVQVATLSGSAVATVSVFETGGAYTSAPGLTGAATVGVGPAAFAGDDACTLDLTMTGMIGTTGISATGGTGASVTFDITLTPTGHTEVRNNNDYTENSLTDEKEVVLQGTVSAGDAPYVGFISYTGTSGLSTRHGIACFGMTAFNPGLTLPNQPGIGPIAGVTGSSQGSHIPVAEDAREWWLSISGAEIHGVIRTTITQVCYAQFYLGLLNRYGSQFTNPYPIFIGASSQTANQVEDSANNTGLSECFKASASGVGSGPNYFRRKSDATWVTVANGQNVSTPAQFDDNCMWPVCSLQIINTSSVPEQRMADDGPIPLADGQIGSNIRANASNRLYPAPDSGDDFFVLWPLTVLATDGQTSNTINLEVVGELNGCFWIGGTDSAGNTVNPEDYFDDPVTGIRYRLFPNGTQGVTSRPYQFVAMAEQ